MTSIVLQEQAKSYIRPVPIVEPGYTVRVHEKIQEGGKERVQVFEGLVINVHRGHVPTDSSFTVRKVVSGIGVEKMFAIHSPSIEKIDVKKVAKTRRAKLYFIRGRTGKAARLIERFTTEDEFGVPVSGEVVAQNDEDMVVAADQPEETTASEAPAAQEKASEA